VGKVRGLRGHLYESLYVTLHPADPDYWEIGDAVYDGIPDTSKRAFLRYLNEASERMGLKQRIKDPKDKKTAYLILNRTYEAIREDPNKAYRFPGFKQFEEEFEMADIQAQMTEHKAKHARKRKLKKPTVKKIPEKKGIVTYEPYKPPTGPKKEIVKYTPYLPPQVAAAKFGVDKAMASAEGFLSSAVQLATTDFFILRGSIQRGTKKKPKTPVNWEIHGNMLGGAAVLLSAGAFLYLADLRIGPYEDTYNVGHYTASRTRPDGTLDTWNGPTVKWRSGDEFPPVPDPVVFPELWHYEWDYHQGRGYGGQKHKVVDSPEISVTPMLITDATRTEKRFGLHERYHKTDEDTEDIIKTNIATGGFLNFHLEDIWLPNFLWGTKYAPSHYQEENK